MTERAESDVPPAAMDQAGERLASRFAAAVASRDEAEAELALLRDATLAALGTTVAAEAVRASQAAEAKAPKRQ